MRVVRARLTSERDSLLAMLRSLTIATLGSALALSGLVAVPTPATAAPLNNGEILAGRAVQEVGPASCTVTNPTQGDTRPVSANGAAVTAAVSGTTTLVDNTDNTDTQTVAVRSAVTARATQTGGQLAGLTLDASLGTTFQAAQGAATDCVALAQPSARFDASVVLPAPRWVSIRAEGLPKSGVFQAQFDRTAPASPMVFEAIQLSGSERGRVSAELLLPAGTYDLVVVTVAQWTSPQDPGDPTALSAAPRISVDFAPVGSAKTRLVGDGAKYLATDNARDCAKGALRAKFAGAAGKVKGGVVDKAVFRVNGKKAKTVNEPKKGKKVKLAKLPAGSDVELKVTLRLAGGGTATATRTFWSCT
jgi:hypothetical protein